MKRFRVMGVALLCCLVGLCGPLGRTASAATEYNLDYVSRYVWRGFDLNPNNHFCVQAGASFPLRAKGWSGTVWANASSVENELNEVDLTLRYDFPGSEHFTVAAGVTHYGWYWAKNFKTENNTTAESFLTLTWPKVSLAPELSIYHDFQNGNGLYAQLKIGHSFKLAARQDVELAATLGYNHRQWIPHSGFTDATLTVSFPIQGKGSSITPFYSTSWILVKDLNPDGAREHWFGLSYAF